MKLLSLFFACMISCVFAFGWSITCQQNNRSLVIQGDGKKVVLEFFSREKPLNFGKTFLNSAHIHELTIETSIPCLQSPKNVAVLDCKDLSPTMTVHSQAITGFPFHLRSFKMTKEHVKGGVSWYEIELFSWVTGKGSSMDNFSFSTQSCKFR